ncbi:MAG TPA: MarR family transcriptional regulator [Mycobacteriales bacterium]|nr:MarR family transcriptional regulator [Mycobacteriales bacterium]
MPAKTASQLDVETAARLRAVVGQLSRRFTRLARGSGLTPSQLSALGVIARRGPIRLSELAEYESVNPTMLSRLVAALDEAGLVRRRTDPADRRAGLLEVTATGRRTHDRLRAERGRVLTAGLERLDPEHVAAVEAALPALEALIEALSGRDGTVK